MSFYETLAEYYDTIFPFNEKKLTLVENKIKTGNSVLDIGCATGELLFAMEQRGIKAAGIDNSKGLTEIALEKKKKRGSDVRILLYGMQDLPGYLGNESFDLITCIGNTLVHLKDLNELEIFLKKIFNLLKDGGVFFGHILNYEKILREGSWEFGDISRGGVVFKRSYKIRDDGRIEFQMELHRDKTKELFSENVLLFPVTYGDVLTCITKSGFENYSFSGDFNGSVFTPSAKDLIFILNKS